MAAWYSVDAPDEVTRLVGAWRDAPIENEEVMGFILGVAREQVLDFGPTLPVVPEGQAVPDPPDRFVYAQLQQATNLWNAGRVSGDGDVGEGGFSFTPRPLDRTIKNIIRPPKGRPRVR